MLDTRTTTTTWARMFCERCKERTVYILVRDTVVKCTMCALERDLRQGLETQGLGLGPDQL